MLGRHPLSSDGWRPGVCNRAALPISYRAPRNAWPTRVELLSRHYWGRWTASSGLAGRDGVIRLSRVSCDAVTGTCRCGAANVASPMGSMAFSPEAEGAHKGGWTWASRQPGSSSQTGCICCHRAGRAGAPVRPAHAGLRNLGAVAGHAGAGATGGRALQLTLAGPQRQGLAVGQQVCVGLDREWVHVMPTRSA